jgi:filamentous hemagglutinin
MGKPFNYSLLDELSDRGWELLYTPASVLRALNTITNIQITRKSGQGDSLFPEELGGNNTPPTGGAGAVVTTGAPAVVCGPTGCVVVMTPPLAGSGGTSGNWVLSTNNGEQGQETNNRLPIPETVTAKNGLQVQSNTKHTAGMPGNTPNAGIEPANSLDLFNSSIDGGNGVCYAIDSNGNINRFFNDGNGVYHWSGSTGNVSAPLNISKIPIDVKRALGFTGK